MSLGRYALGAAALVVVLASLSLTAARVRRRWMSDWTGAPARLAEIVIGIATLVAILELLGTVGWFELAPIVAACAVVGGASLMLTPGGRRPSRPPGRTAGLAAAGIAVAVTVAVAAEWTGATLQSYDVGIRTFDSVWYHLPWAASFAQTGHIAPLRFTDIEYLTAFYPATAEMLHGLGIVFLGHDTLSPVLNLIWAMLALFAAWCVGRARGAGTAATAGVAVVLSTPMMHSSQAGSAANDIVGMFFLVASVALVLAGDGRTPALVLAAVAAGLAVATKLSMVAPALALAVGVIAIAPRGRRGSTAAVWLAALVLAGGYWYARNLIAVGNPLPWTSLGILPTPAAPLQQHTGFAVAHYLTSSHAWKDFFEPGLAAGLGRWWSVILAFAVVGPVLCLLPGAGSSVRMLGLVALVSLAAYLITPETAAGPAGDPAGFAFNLRYAAPALALCFAVLPLAPAFDGPGRQSALVVALAVVLIATVTKGSLWPHRHLLGIVLVAAALSAAGLALVAIGGRPQRGVIVLAAALLLLAGAAAGYGWQRHYLRGRYQFNPGVTALAHTWDFFRSVHHARVGVVGTFGGFFSYPLWGPDDSNRVQYVGARGPHGSFTAIATCRQWREALNAGRFQYVVTTPARDPWHPKRLAPSPESGWTGSDPAAKLVLRHRSRGQLIAVYRIHGRVHPGNCH
ncbi:MAG TPA: hypothetical protein VFI54_27225 [Solirubrobacteraceae bacterium]|nr:hypothetical protein [Solirubrobacteraceae bacterium]